MFDVCVWCLVFGLGFRVRVRVRVRVWLVVLGFPLFSSLFVIGLCVILSPYCPGLCLVLWKFLEGKEKRKIIVAVDFGRGCSC
jgi:hypothetical protein